MTWTIENHDAVCLDMFNGYTAGSWNGSVEVGLCIWSSIPIDPSPLNLIDRYLDKVNINVRKLDQNILQDIILPCPIFTEYFPYLQLKQLIQKRYILKWILSYPGCDPAGVCLKPYVSGVPATVSSGFWRQGAPLMKKVYF